MIRGINVSVVALAAITLATSAYAADLGGNCCADLEERVAELEATVAKKGTRKTSLVVYGWVNKTMLHWDDGVQQNNYLGIDNTNSATRFGLRGDASVRADLKAGYSILLDVFTGGTTARADQLSEDGANVIAGSVGGANCTATPAAARPGTTAAVVPCTVSVNNTFDDHLIRMRDANVWLESTRLGRVTLGRLSSTGPQGTIDLGGIANAASGSFSLIGNNFKFRNGVTGATTPVTIGGVTDQAADYGGRVDGLRWDSPTWHGFVVGASIGEARDIDRDATLGQSGTLGHLYALNLRYAGEFNGVRVASAIGYEVSNNEETLSSTPPNTRPNSVNFGTSSSLLHVATGLFLQGHYNTFKRGNDDGSADKAKAWQIQAGVTRNFFGMGNTALYAELGSVKNGDETFRFRDLVLPGFESDYRMWGLGVTQNIDAAAMQLYAGYRNHSLDGTVFGQAQGFKDIGLLAVGARINF